MSGSMEPEIKTGSVAYINSKVKAEEIKIGDIIGFTTKEGQVTHRVVEINSDGSFVTKGDNNEEEDTSPVQADKVKGRTVFTIPVIGKLAAMAKTKQGICVICVYIFLNSLCIIFDNKIYNDEIPSSFKEAIMKCESLDEIKKLIVEEMDSFKEQIIDDISSANLQVDSNQNSKTKQLENASTVTKNDSVENKECVNKKQVKADNQENSAEIVDLLSRIDSLDEEDVDLEQIKEELVEYNNPKLLELRNRLNKNMESAKIIEIDSIKKSEPVKKRKTTKKKSTVKKVDNSTVKEQKAKQTRKRKSACACLQARTFCACLAERSDATCIYRQAHV